METHQTDPKQILLNLWHRASGFIVAVLCVFCVMLIQGYLSIQDEARGLSKEVNAYKVRGCPDSLGGKPFRFSVHESVNLFRPGYETLSCFYGGEK